MQFKVFSIPVGGDSAAEDELNQFLRAHRAVSVQRELLQSGSTASWAFCVEYLDAPRPSTENTRGRQRVDYKTMLSEDDFALFAQLRDRRKQLASQDAIPVYAVCTNKQLAEIAKARPASLADLKRIEGLGEAKKEKYGETFLEILNETRAKQNGETHAEGGTLD